MSIKKEKVNELIKPNAFGESIYVWSKVETGNFKNALCIKALEEKTRPKRYLICEKCGKGYEGYLIKQDDIFRNSEETINEFYCKKCTIKRPFKQANEKINKIFNNNKQEILNISNELLVNTDDILFNYILNEAKNKINNEQAIEILEQLLKKADKKFDKKINEIFDKLK